MRYHQNSIFLGVLSVIILVVGCSSDTSGGGGGTSPVEPPNENFYFTSSFDTNTTIPFVYHSGGRENKSPSLEWTNILEETNNLIVFMYDASDSDVHHWIRYNIPTDTSTLVTAVDGDITDPFTGSAIAGGNSIGGYLGPATDEGTRSYHIVLFELLENVIVLSENDSLRTDESLSQSELGIALYDFLFTQKSEGKISYDGELYTINRWAEIVGSVYSLEGIMSYPSINSLFGETQSFSPVWTGAREGQLVEYTVDPSFPSGISLDQDTGTVTVSDTAEKTTSPLEFTVTALGKEGDHGFRNAVLFISVLEGSDQFITGTLDYDPIITSYGDKVDNSVLPIWTNETENQTISYALVQLDGTPPPPEITIDSVSGEVSVDTDMSPHNSGTYLVVVNGTGVFKGVLSSEITISLTTAIEGVLSYDSIDTNGNVMQGYTSYPQWSQVRDSNQQLLYDIFTQGNESVDNGITIDSNGVIRLPIESNPDMSGVYKIMAQGVAPYTGVIEGTISISITVTIDGTLIYDDIQITEGSAVDMSPQWENRSMDIQVVEYSISRTDGDPISNAISIDSVTGIISISNMALEEDGGEHRIDVEGMGSYIGTLNTLVQIVIDKNVELFTVVSSSFSHGGEMDFTHHAERDYDGNTYYGSNISPQLSWRSIPEQTASYIVFLYDEQDNIDEHHYWIRYNIPQSTTSLVEYYEGDFDLITDGVDRGERIKGGRNAGGYMGPSPTASELGVHNYHFVVFALEEAMISALSSNDSARIASSLHVSDLSIALRNYLDNNSGTSAATLSYAGNDYNVLGWTEIIGTVTAHDMANIEVSYKDIEVDVLNGNTDVSIPQWEEGIDSSRFTYEISGYPWLLSKFVKSKAPWITEDTSTGGISAHTSQGIQIDTSTGAITVDGGASIVLDGGYAIIVTGIGNYFQSKLIFISVSITRGSWANDTMSTPISVDDYQSMLGMGLNVDWSKTTSGKNSYDRGDAVDFYDRGLRHVRIRIKDPLNDADHPGESLEERLFEYKDDDGFTRGLDLQIQDSLDNQLIPILAYKADEFKNDPLGSGMGLVVNWWKAVAERYQSLPPYVAFNLILEVTGDLQSHPDRLNEYYETVIPEIRLTNPNRILIVAPNIASDPYELQNLDFSMLRTDPYLMAEWHFYASGPSPDSGDSTYWTTGTAAQKQLITDAIATAKQWEADEGIPTWVGSWMAGNYNSGNDYDISAQKVFGQFMSCILTKNEVPFAVNSDTKYYDRSKNTWLADNNNSADDEYRTGVSILDAILNHSLNPTTCE